MKLEFSPEQLKNTSLRSYDWNKQALELYRELDDFFHGNLGNFFGQSLYGRIPSSALGKDREAFEKAHIAGTHLDWLRGRTDHYLVADFDNELDVTDYEGVGRIWMPHWAARAIVTTACDKLAILDDMKKKVESGRLQIEPTQKSK